MAAIAIGSDCILIGTAIINCNQLGLCIDEYIVESIAISSDRVQMDGDSGFDGGFDGGFNGGFDGQFHLSVLGYQPQQSIQQLS